MAKTDYSEIARRILENVGGAANIVSVSHCMTRLRLTLKDKALVNKEEIERTNKVIGTTWGGDQLQVIIGTDVGHLYDAFIKLGSFDLGEISSENLDAPKEKMTWNAFFRAIVSYVSGSVLGVIPVLIAAGLATTINVIFGPSTLKLYDSTSTIYRFFEFIHEGGMYFMPVFVGYHAAKKLKIDPNYGIMMGCILITPSLISVVNAGEPFVLFGISMKLVNYSQSVLPVLLSVALMGAIHKLLAKYVPKTLSALLVPFLTMILSVPLALLFLAPIGTILGGYVASAIMWLETHFRALGCGIVAGIWVLLVMTGMHWTVGFVFFPVFFSRGIDYMMLPAWMVYTTASWGVGLAATIMLKDKNAKSEALGIFISNILGGVSEPTVFGLLVKYKKLLPCQMIGGFCGGLACGILQVSSHLLVANNFAQFVELLGGGVGNLVKGLIASAIAMGVSLVLACVWGMKGENAKKAAEV